ncbi:MAG: anhydro-N-acetylmuramic acid kinase [Bacteroidota bacterium]
MANSTKSYLVLGLMSGSSLDGLDIAFAKFDFYKKDISWELLKAETLSFSSSWKSILQELPGYDSKALLRVNSDFGHYSAELVNTFLEKHNVSPDFIAAHGHTVFHFPEDGFTTQIGDGAALAVGTGLPVICDFRTHDIALGGQGAPLAPVADSILFPGFDFYLNLGGIANITFIDKGEVTAFDICPANQVLNHLSEEVGLEFDARGGIAREGKNIPALRKKIDGIPYFSKPYPKTLDNNWIREQVFPIFDTQKGKTKDKLNTACWHIAEEISKAITELMKEKNSEALRKVLITGGGAFNDYLIECIKSSCQQMRSTEIILPSPDIIAFKEALLMALLGALRIENRPNSISSATGAQFDSIGGAIYQGTKKHI